MAVVLAFSDIFSDLFCSLRIPDLTDIPSVFNIAQEVMVITQEYISDRAGVHCPVQITGNPFYKPGRIRVIRLKGL